MICIKLTSRGPIFFKQTRLGLNANPFSMYKFRTMYIDDYLINDKKFAKDLIHGKFGEIGTAPMFKLANDPRVTPFGMFLRKTSLDELPQFLNVLTGDLSLVGPRPALPYEYEYYEEWQKERLSVKPGITGLWQVTGRSTTTFDEMVKLDIQYVRTMSFGLDIKIMAKTVFIVFARQGAY